MPYLHYTENNIFVNKEFRNSKLMFTGFVTKYNTVATKFGNWLLERLADRDWTQSQLAKRAKISRQVLYNYINHPRENPDKDILSDIARALDLPETEVFRAAGILEAAPNITPLMERAIHYLSQLSPDDQERVVLYLEVLASRYKYGKERP